MYDFDKLTERRNTGSSQWMPPAQTPSCIIFTINKQNFYKPLEEDESTDMRSISGDDSL